MVKRKKILKSKKMKVKNLALAVGAAVLVVGSVPVAKRVVFPGEMVTEVIDGDSFKIKNKQTIRLASLDAPAPEYCLGQEAKKALEKKYWQEGYFKGR